MDCETKYKRSISFISEECLKIMESLQKVYFNDEITLFDEEVYVTHHEGESSFFHVFDSTSFILLQKPFEKCNQVYEQTVQEETFDTCSTPVKVQELVETPDLNITGSPLMCPIMNLKNLNLESSQDDVGLCLKSHSSVKIYSGFTLKKARYILTKFGFALKMLKGASVLLPPVWIACDGNNSNNNVFIGIYQTEETCFTSLINSSGPYFGIEELPSLDYVNDLFKFSFPLSSVDSEVEAWYEVLNKGASGSTLRLKCQWSRPNSILCQPKLDTFTSVILHLNPNDQECHTYFLHKELKFLQNLINGLEERCIKWLSSTDDKIEMMDLLNDYIQFLGEGVRKEKESYVSSLESVIESELSELRSNLSFSDDMWNILKCSKSASDLKKGLALIFKVIQSGSVRPQIHVKNNTQFAVICRDLMGRMIEIPSLEDIKSIQILIEMGLEKIRNDYVASIEEWDLVTAEQLTPFINWNSREHSYSDSLLQLQKLLIVLQTVVLLKAHIYLPNNSLSFISGKMLQDLKNSSHIQKDFDFQIRTSLIKDVIGSLTPISWLYGTWNAFNDNQECGKWLKYYIKKDEPFLKTNSSTSNGTVEDVTYLGSNDTLKIEKDKFYCLTITNTISGV